VTERIVVDFASLPTVDDDNLASLSSQRTLRFEQDSSELEDRACWALQNLLARRYLSKEQHPELWSWLIAHRRKLASRLSELDLVLVIDDSIEYAYVEQADYESQWGRKLLRKETLNTYDSVLAMHLAKMMRAAPDGRVLIGRDDIHALFAVVDNQTDRDDKRFADRINGAIKKLDEVDILLPTDDDDTFTVSPVILSIMTASRIEELQAQFTALANAGMRGGSLDTEGDEVGAADAGDEEVDNFEAGTTGAGTAE
jgi:hypothetical protein